METARSGGGAGERAPRAPAPPALRRPEHRRPPVGASTLQGRRGDVEEGEEDEEPDEGGDLWTQMMSQGAEAVLR